MNPEDSFCGLNARTAKVRRYWSQRDDRMVRHWMRTWLGEIRGLRRSLCIHDPDEIEEGKSIFLRTSYMNVLAYV